jgi:non-specific protein-tyrosine kinase
VLEGVIQALSLDMTATDLRRAIFVEPVRDTQLIEIRVEDTDPVRGAQIANALVTVFAQQNQALQAARYADVKDSLSMQLNELTQKISSDSSALQAVSDDIASKAERDRLETILTQDRQTYAYLLQTYEQVRLAEAQSTSNVIQAEPATVPERPIRPRTLQNTILAAMFGLVFSVGVVLLIETLDDSVKGPADVTRSCNLPVLGVISRHNTDGGRPVTVAEPRSPVSEAFRALRTNIQFASVDRPMNTILVTSASPAEGKTTITVNLALVMAQSGRRVALIDGDLRRPKLHRRLGVPNRTGLSGLFVQPLGQMDGALQKTETTNLRVLTSGDLPPNPAELLGSDKMHAILRQVREEVDVILIDTPPIMAVTDAAVLAPKMDGVLLVVKPGVTKQAALRSCADQLSRVGANLLGVILNDVEFGRSRYGYNYYYKGYYYAYQEYYGDTNNKSPRSGRHKPQPQPAKTAE